MRRLDLQQREAPPEMQQFYRAIGAAIRERRRQMVGSDGRVMSQVALAARIGRGGPVVSHIEAGRVKLYTHLLDEIAKVLQVPTAELLPRSIDPREVRE